MGKVDETKTIKREEEEGKEGKTVTMAPAVPHKQRKGQKKGAKKGKGKGGKRGGKREGRGRKRTGRLTENIDVRSKRWTSASRRRSQ